MKRREFLQQIAFTAGSAFMAGALYSQTGTGVELKNNAIDLRPGKNRPNIVFILADDMGYGDIKYLNPESKIPTPNMDRLAAEGIYFTDAHTPSAVCTPTRYGVLTGRYCWRSRLKKGVLNGYSKRLIEPGRLTVASMLKESGYRTGCVGKWHLGLTDTQPADFNLPLTPGPNEVGFDYWFGIPASLDMPPYCFIENGAPTEPVTATVAGEPYPRFYRSGAASPGFDVDDVMPKITQKACHFIEDHQARHAGQPFFLYFPLTAPHTPWLPLEQNYQRSKAGVYGDFVTLVDWTVGQVMKTIEKNGIKDNTLIIVTSDNGSHIAHIGEHNNGVSDPDKYNFGHDANYIYRGQKSDVWDGGHHTPFIARWPDRIKSGTKSDETICLVDLTATCAALVGYQLPDNAAEDSYNILPALLGESLTNPIREATVHHSIEGKFAIRKGKWKFLDCAGSGGWSTGGDKLPGQLYDMEADPRETTNLFQSPEHQAIVTELKTLLEKYKSQGYSRPM